MINTILHSDTLKLEGILFNPEDKKEKYPAILFVHGWTSEKTRSFQYAKALTKLGYICFLFDMRGHGKSEGDRNISTNKDFLQDVITAYDYLSQLDNVEPENISAVGSSFGGYLVAMLTAKRKIKNLVLRAPADYPNEAFNQQKVLFSGDDPTVISWRNTQKNMHKTYALEAVNKFNGNVLIIESEKDNRVPHQTIMNYFNAVKDKNKLEHIMLKDAPHSIQEGKFRDDVEKILVSWFTSMR